ncbi:hypothetical protein CAPTEDRAFT_204673 [Capitella teleta]|uniref:EGF-like domain-containing protein n=1 Tax=Capitella teleta TaxID=283909 RepID=R7UQJ0_CAPTE|nr:hypothetical protein CAPTEDRAFT_204673 [Capitella teleta]|eukprot:ELU08794.1 hypothetical protein CAPTEDRAFT_204673 [Capitella teleta]
MADASYIAVAVETRSLEQRQAGHAFVEIVCPTGKNKGAGDPVIDKKPNCENECHCNDELPCLYSNGTCADGCATGWRGDACNERDCKFENGGCQHRCTEGIRDEWCACDEGFDISPNDLRKCLDINECAGERGEVYNKDCHTCVNTIGSYTCECDDGYGLDSATNQTCIGQYRGCYEDRRDRALEFIAYRDRSGINSNGRCIRDCGFRGFTFAGTQSNQSM